MHMKDKLKIIVPLSECKNGDKITKVSGSKIYTVRPKITVYGEKGKFEEPSEILCSEGCVFLVSDDGRINAHPKTDQVALSLSFEELEYRVKIEGN